MSQSYSERINNVKIMLASLKANTALLAKWGINEAYVTAMETLYNTVQALDNEHEATKAKLKTTTVELDQKMYELEQIFRNTKKIIKIELPQEAWVGYGFNVTR